MNSKSILAGLAVLALWGCGQAPGPSADESKTPAQVKTEVAAAETPAIESAIQAYKEVIASHEGDLEDLRERIEEMGGKALDGLLGGEGKSDEMKADLERLKSDADALVATIKELEAKLQVYVAELAQRNA